MKRRVFPRRFTVRWFATRGWAFGAAFTFGVCAMLFRPEPLSEPSWVLPVLFADAAVALGLLGWWPERQWLRLWAVFGSVAACLCRLWFLGDNTAIDARTQFASGCIWLFIAYACWLLATLTAKIPSRR